jgi:hypothetical protein
MSVSEKIKCIDGNDKDHSISRQCELLQLPRTYELLSKVFLYSLNNYMVPHSVEKSDG